MHDGSLTVKLTIKRGEGQADDVVVTVNGLPPGVTAEPLTIKGSEDSGDLVVKVAASTTQGPFTATVEGATARNVKASTGLDLFVRGRPGTIDTTFASNGVLTVPPSRGTELGIDAQGRLYIGTQASLQRFSADGVADTSFAAGALSARTPLGVVVQPGGVYFFFNDNAHRVEKYSVGDGKLDTSYGGGDGRFERTGSQASGFAIADDGRAAMFAPFYSAARWHLQRVSPTGTSDGVIDSSTLSASPRPQLVRAAAFHTGKIVFVGEGHIARLSAGTYDTTFANVGYLEIDPGLLLNDVIVDASNRYLVTGHRLSSNALYLARVTTAGALDPSFPPVTSAFAIKAEEISVSNDNPSGYTFPYAGRLALVPDGRIVQAAQVDEGGGLKCTVLRYQPDGKLDGVFGNQGRSTLPTPGCTARRVLIQPDGRIIVGGGTVVMRVWD